MLSLELLSRNMRQCLLLRAYSSRTIVPKHVASSIKQNVEENSVPSPVLTTDASNYYLNKV